MRKIINKFGKWMLALLFLIMLVPGLVHAAPLINTNIKGSLTLIFAPDEKPARGVEFKLYRIADVSQYGGLTATEKFSQYQLSFSDIKSDDWDEMTLTLQGYIAADKIMPDYFAETDINGQIAFENLSVGVYLVAGDIYSANDNYYMPQAYIVSLPGKDENNAWKYHQESTVKYEVRPDQKPMMLEVLKVWHADDAAERPGSVIVEVYEGSSLYTTVTLSAANNWRHTLTGLKAGSVWSVREKTVPVGYTVMVENQPNRIVVNNTKVPDEPETEPETEPESERESESGTESETESEPETEPETKLSESTEEKLPQTGVLWWPVPVLIAVGLLCIAIGFFLRRSEEDGR